jgi:hypothetical protein
MKEIIELNNRLVGQVGKCSSEDVLMLGRDSQPGELERLPVGIQAEIEVFRGKVNEVVPNDFDWALFLGDDSPDFTIEYNDGPLTGFFRGHDWESERCIIEQLKGFDWEAERQQAISGCQVFDDLRANAEHWPSRLPPTKEIQKRFRDEMKEFVQTKRKDASRVHVMLWRDDEGVKDETYEDSLTDFRRKRSSRGIACHNERRAGSGEDHCKHWGKSHCGTPCHNGSHCGEWRERRGSNP